MVRQLCCQGLYGIGLTLNFPMTTSPVTSGPINYTYIYIYIYIYIYTDHAALEIPVNSRITSPFSRQIANGNAGPTSALESVGAKRSFRCHLLNIGPSYK